MKVRWKRDGADWIIQLSGSLRWSTRSPGPITRLRDECARFLRQSEGLAILDLSDVEEADPRNVIELLGTFRELRDQKRLRLSGRGSAIAALVSDGTIPWIEREREATLLGATPLSGEHAPPPGEMKSSWQKIIEDLPEGSGEAAAAWGDTVKKIDAMMEGIDTPSDAGTETIDPRDRAPLPASADRVKPGTIRKSTEQVAQPLLWFDDGLEGMLGSASKDDDASQRKTRKKPVRGVAPIEKSPPPGADVFEWFFSMGEAAVQNEVSGADETIVGTPEETRVPRSNISRPEPPPSVPPSSAPTVTGSTPPPGASSGARNSASPKPPAPKQKSMVDFELPLGKTPLPLPPKEPLAISADSAGDETPNVEATKPPEASKTPPVEPSTPAPTSLPDSGEFESFGFPSIPVAETVPPEKPTPASTPSLDSTPPVEPSTPAPTSLPDSGEFESFGFPSIPVAETVPPEEPTPSLDSTPPVEPSTPAPTSLPASGEFEPFGFPSIDEIAAEGIVTKSPNEFIDAPLENVIEEPVAEAETSETPDSDEPVEAEEPIARPRGFEKFPGVIEIHRPTPMEEPDVDEDDDEVVDEETSLSSEPTEESPELDANDDGAAELERDEFVPPSVPIHVIREEDEDLDDSSDDEDDAPDEPAEDEAVLETVPPQEPVEPRPSVTTPGPGTIVHGSTPSAPEPNVLHVKPITLKKTIVNAPGRPSDLSPSITRPAPAGRPTGGETVLTSKLPTLTPRTPAPPERGGSTITSSGVTPFNAPPTSGTGDVTPPTEVPETSASLSSEPEDRDDSFEVGADFGGAPEISGGEFSPDESLPPEPSSLGDEESEAPFSGSTILPAKEHRQEEVADAAELSTDESEPAEENPAPQANLAADSFSPEDAPEESAEENTEPEEISVDPASTLLAEEEETPVDVAPEPTPVSSFNVDGWFGDSEETPAELPEEPTHDETMDEEEITDEPSASFEPPVAEEPVTPEPVVDDIAAAFQDAPPVAPVSENAVEPDEDQSEAAVDAFLNEGGFMPQPEEGAPRAAQPDERFRESHENPEDEQVVVDLLGGEFADDDVKPAPKEDADFVIDLEMEQLYLERSPNEKDKVEETRGIQFAKQWNPLESGGEFVKTASPKGGPAADPVDLLLAGGGTDEEAPAAPVAPAPVAKEEPSIAAPAKTVMMGNASASMPIPPDEPPSGVQDPPDEAPGEARRERLRNAAQPFLQFFPSDGGGDEAPAASGGAGGEAMMRAIGRLLGDFEELDQEREMLADEVDQLNAELEERARELETLRATVHELEARSDSPDELTIEPAGWHSAHLSSPVNPEPFRVKFSSGHTRFRATGSVEPSTVLEDIIALERHAPAIAAGIGANIDRTEATAGDGWRGMLLIVSTLVREGGDPSRRRRGLRAAWLASLVRCAPGAEGRDASQIAAAVMRLLQGATYRFADEAEFDGEELANDLALWHAAEVLDALPRLAPKRWRGTVGRVLAKHEGDEVLKRGLSRLVEAHSMFFPGVWVELTTGDIGPVVGANPGRPDLPRVMVLFRRKGMRGARVPPRLTPASTDATFSVLRVLSQPHVAEREEGQLAVDLGGSAVVPKDD